MLNGLDLFSGIGGLAIALSPWVRPVAYCENDRYAQAVLLSRMADQSIPLAPIWDDVRTLGSNHVGPVDIIYGGFPCQDISVAGTGEGLAGERSGLFFEVMRLAKEIRPQFLFLENVPAIRLRGLDRVGQELAHAGYDCRWGALSAYDVGAVHKRERWFLLAHSNGMRLREERGKEVRRYHAKRFRPLEFNGPSETRGAPWSPPGLSEPRVDRAGDGVLCRVDRHRGLGNAVVPAQAREAFMRLVGKKIAF